MVVDPGQTRFSAATACRPTDIPKFESYGVWRYPTLRVKMSDRESGILIWVKVVPPVLLIVLLKRGGAVALPVQSYWRKTVYWGNCTTASRELACLGTKGAANEQPKAGWSVATRNAR
jgi:hypothetical protein